MSTIAARGKEVNRPASVSAAVLLTVILIVVGIPLFLILPGGDETPGSAIVIGVVTGLVTLGGAWGLWQVRRWGAILTFVLVLLNLLSSLPGLVFADDAWTVALIVTTTPLQVAILVLIALRSSRRAYR
jgi:hypothetical protein